MTSLALSAADLLGMFAHFMMLSLLSIGGAIATVPEIHRYMVIDHHWMTDTQFTASVAMAQAAPGPNMLFVAVLGWTAGGTMGAIAATIGILLPSTVLSLNAMRWGAARRHTVGVRAFTQGLAPLTLGLLVSTGWILSGPAQGHLPAMLLTAITIPVIAFTRISPMWAVLVGAVVGAVGLV